MTGLSTYHSQVGSIDVAIIGAGINGLAVAREAARLGLSVALIDQDDVGTRTSAISTRLIHGGLKYLERFELNLVHESIRERDILLKCAPHLVRPYPLFIPFSKTQSRPGWLLACGLMFHDLLSIGKQLPLNRLVFRKRLARDWPALAEAGLKWGGLFQDANVPFTERLTTELAIDAQSHGALVLTHTRVEELVRTEGCIAGLRYRDREDGTLKFLSARVVVNAAGPWVDDILELAGGYDQRIGPTKGSHCVVDTFPGAPSTCIFFESPDDSRPLFILPWAGRYMLGTTDIPYNGSLETIEMDDEEVKYLLEAVNSLIPQAALRTTDVLWSYSGVRPLPYVDNLDDPSKVSRDHQIIEHKGKDAGLITIIGGKLTTHRSLGELVSRRVLRRLGLSRRRSPTRRALLPGAPTDASWDDYRTTYIATSRLPEPLALRLIEIYGTIAERIENIAVSETSMMQEIDAETGAIAAEVVHAVRQEGAVTLEDIMLRRTLVGINSDVGLTAAPVAAAVLVAVEEWTESYADAQVRVYRAAVKRLTPRALVRRTKPMSESERTP